MTIADPSNPVVAITDLMSGIGEYSDSHRNEAVLVYDSAPLEEPVTLIGESRAVVHVSISTPDTDLVVNLHEVYPDGRAIRLGPEAASGCATTRVSTGRCRSSPAGSTPCGSPWRTSGTPWPRATCYA